MTEFQARCGLDSWSGNAKTVFFWLLVAIAVGQAGRDGAEAGVITFGVAGNSFEMEFVPIGSPGNAPDTTGTPNPAGSVAYVYGIGKFEVSRRMVETYNAVFGTANTLQISLADLTPYGGNGPDKPATLSWNSAARFVNWLNTSTGGYAAYKYNTGGVNANIATWSASDVLDYDPSNPYRSRRATFALPSANEWYKAAYYDPGSGAYFNHGTGSDTRPTSVASGTAPGTAVWNRSGPANVDQAGGLSAYGVMGLSANAWDWEESSFDLTNSSSGLQRGIRGGSWLHGPNELSSSWRNPLSPITAGDANVGFRVVQLIDPRPVPEPSQVVIYAVGAAMVAYAMKRRRRDGAQIQSQDAS
jgi:sulfatase modifying factor 1